MADFDRCFCGAQSLTISGFCSEHKDRETYRAPEVDTDTKIKQLQSRLSYAERQLRETREELKTQEIRARELNKILVLVDMGDIKIEEIRGILRSLNEKQKVR